ncbi:unnamed protein product, partial [Symbiodinium sp. KB8]
HADVVIKAQVLAGGRGLGTFKNGFQGGVHVVTRPGQAKDLASKMLGQKLVTKQSACARGRWGCPAFRESLLEAAHSPFSRTSTSAAGAEGLPCEKVLLMERVYMRKEMYLSILMDRASGGPVIVASAQGGTSIEDVAEATPEAISTTPVDIEKGPTPEQLADIAAFLGFSEEAQPAAKEAVANLYRMFKATDATLLEVNPLCETPEAQVFVADAKVNFDDNAAFRQGDIFSLRDTTQEDPREVAASKADLNYIGLDGDIGCMVNGAGLAMSTMDLIKLHGGEPANFLDVGGGASEAQVEKAFGILNGAWAHPGILNAAKNLHMTKPIVLRLMGTNVKEAKKLINTSGFKVILTDDLDDAAAKAVKMANIVQQAEEVAVDVKFELPL